MTLRPRTPAISVLLFLGFFFFNGVITETQAQQVQVNAADPAAAEQGTIDLNVKITGRGFKRGASSQFLVTGTTDPGGIIVNSTTFVSSTELTANITVADTATISNFDIQVLNSDGRGGKGTELFAVTAKANASVACEVQPLPSQISLLHALNYVTPTGSPAFGPSFGVNLKARAMTLNSSQVVVLAVGMAAAPRKLEIFLFDPFSGQILDGTIIGTGSNAQPHITVDFGAGARSMAVGDVNADGIPDFVAGSTATNTVHAVVGAVNNGILSYQSYILPMPANAAGVGWTVAMGDLSGTGNDVIAAQIGWGSSSSPDQVALFSFDGFGFVNFQNIVSPLPNKAKDEDFGAGLAIADVTGSGAKDLVVGAPGSNVNRVTGAGRVFVYPGPVTASNYIVLSTNVKSDRLGGQVAAGLINGDGFNDLLATSAAAGKIYNGLVTNGQSLDLSLQPIDGLSTGWATTEPDIADVNGDLLEDVIIGTPNAASGSICGGVAYLYLSFSGMPAATRLMISTPALDTTSPQVFGWAVAFVPGTRLFFVSDHGLALGDRDGAGQVYVYKLN